MGMRFVFSDCLKRLYNKSGCLRYVGPMTRDPAALKAQSPKLVRVRLTRSARVSAERSLLGRTLVQSSVI